MSSPPTSEVLSLMEIITMMQSTPQSPFESIRTFGILSHVDPLTSTIRLQSSQHGSGEEVIAFGLPLGDHVTEHAVSMSFDCSTSLCAEVQKYLNHWIQIFVKIQSRNQDDQQQEGQVLTGLGWRLSVWLVVPIGKGTEEFDPDRYMRCIAIRRRMVHKGVKLP
eukprot:PhF_6_TR10227/c0_g1_i1/m.15850